MAVRVYGPWTPFYWTMPLSRCACVHSKPVKSTLENVTRPLRDKGERKRGLQRHPCKLRAGETIHSSILLENSCVKCGKELHIHKRGCNGTPVKLCSTSVCEVSESRTYSSAWYCIYISSHPTSIAHTGARLGRPTKVPATGCPLNCTKKTITLLAQIRLQYSLSK